MKTTISHNMKKVTADLTYFPKKNILIGVKTRNLNTRRFNKENSTANIPLEKVSDYKGLKLCNYKKLWWIYYNPNDMTGHFDSRKKAIEWFTNAGR